MNPDIWLILKVVGAVVVAALAVIAAVWKAIALPNLRGDFVTKQEFEQYKDQDDKDCSDCRLTLDCVDEKLAAEISTIRVELTSLSKESAEHKGNIKWIRETLTEVKNDVKAGMQSLSDKLDRIYESKHK